MTKKTSTTTLAAGTFAVAIASTTAAFGSSSNPKHFVPPTAVPTYGPNNYIVSFDGGGEISSYGTPQVTGSTSLWTVGDAFTTKQEWTDMDDNRVSPSSLSVRPDAGTGFVHGTGSFTDPLLTARSPGFITGSQNFYSFSNDYGADALVANYGGTTGSLAAGGTLFLMQTAAGINPDYRPVINVGDITGPETFNGGALTITKGDGSALPAAPQTLLFDKNFQLAETPTNFGDLPYQELIWGVWLPNWTGDFKVGFDLAVHSMFSSVRFDTAVGSMNGAPSLANFTVGLGGPLYWDTNGTAAGAGGATPSGNWDGTAANFNSDAAGGIGGSTTAATSGSRDVIFAAGADATGAYTVTLIGTQTAKSVTVARGNVTFAGTGAINAPSIEVASGAAATLGAGVGTSGGLTVTVNDGGTLRTQTGRSAPLDVATLSVAPTGKLDLNDSGLVKRNGGSGAAGQTATRNITALLKSGLENVGNFDWLGNGISSTEANADNALAGSVLYGIGVIQNNLASAGTADGTTTDATPGGEIYTTFKGQPVGLNDTLVRYTYMGDADLSGNIDGTDYSLIDAGFGAGLSGWLNGDFDYSGSIDGTDYALIDNAFGAQIGVLPEQFQAIVSEHAALFGQEYVDALAAVQSGVVPEPAMAGSVVLMSWGALMIRRRRRQD